MKKTDIPCAECDRGTMRQQIVELAGIRAGETFVVKVPGFRCDVCNYSTIDNKQSEVFTRAVSDAYRRQYELLTGDEIKGLRNKLQMNQVQFAEFLGVGSASVKRWESGQIQDRAMDELMRLKADSSRARSNYQSLEGRLSEHCSHPIIVFNGDDVELSTCVDQRYSSTSRTTIEMDVSGLNLDHAFSPDEDLVAA